MFPNSLPAASYKEVPLSITMFWPVIDLDKARSLT
jgi:hypothetical protein